MNPKTTRIQLEATSNGEADPTAEIILQPASQISDKHNLNSAFGEVLWVASPGPGPGRILQSLGSKLDYTAEDFRTVGGLLAQWLLEHQIELAQVPLDKSPEIQSGINLSAFLEGLILGSYSFSQYKSGDVEGETKVLISGSSLASLPEIIEKSTAIASAVNYGRYVAQQPPNAINPATLVLEAQRLAEDTGLKFEHLGEKELGAMGAGAITAVGQGSQTQSELIILEHPGHGEKATEPPIVILGKAITFDTGGYAIKSLYGMATMKYDKCGGASVLGIMQGVAALKPECRVIGVVAAAENMISDKAYRPNDIIQSLSGKSIEVISTDAEGRLVLADAITYACRTFKPSVMVDLATLTGGAFTALGKVRAGLLSTDDRLIELLMVAGIRTHERLWPLPLDDEYFELIRGKDSDLVNSFHHPAGVPVPASTIMGGMFLKQFVEGPYPWAHIDIAATAKSKTKGAYIPRGATGFGIRLILDFIENYNGLE